ncbi:hypothetical protein ASZ90_020145 [hydrocarbon metagenome]|uniref:Uncharacterized protein n=1 Tax=hydrocarbon metagenome TaxID=938273 RepID=A0A0W8E244_9ZZZZ
MLYDQQLFFIMKEASIILIAININSWARFWEVAGKKPYCENVLI